MSESGSIPRISDRTAMIAGMEPWLDPEDYRYAYSAGELPADVLKAAFATFREKEGWSAIVPADSSGSDQQNEPLFRRIVLQVHSDLLGVGLTASVAEALAQNNIPCNIVAAYHHDHVFVPAAKGQEAFDTLRDLMQSAGVSQP